MKKNVFILSLALFASFSFAQPRAPLQVSSQNPFSRIFAIPHAEQGQLLEPKQQSTHISIDLASNYYTDTSGNEGIIIDSESTQAMIRYRYGFDHWEAGIDIPFIKHSGGFLDGFINDWHDSFGLTSGGRELAAKGQLQYQYSLNNSPLLNINQKSSGIGDIRLTGGYQLLSGSPFDLALRGSIKLPTGKSDYLRGSGGTDINVGLALSDHSTFAKYNSSYFVNGGVLLTEDGDVLPQIRENVVYYFSTGIAKDVFTHWQLKLQLDGHSQLYNSALDPLSESIQLSIAATVELTNDLLLDFAVAEDVIVGSASDVNFHINLYNKF